MQLKPNVTVAASIRELVRDTRALAMIEMAFMLPILLVLSIAGMELANVMLMHSKVSNTALTIADNASRIAAGSVLSKPQVRDVDIYDVFLGASRSAGSMDIQNRGRIILSSLEINEQDGQWIHWQRCYGSLPLASAYGPQGTGASGKGFPGMGPAGRQIKAGPGNAIMFAEVSYRYEPLIISALPAEMMRIDYEAAFAVRDDRDTPKGIQQTGAPNIATPCTGIIRNSNLDPRRSAQPNLIQRFIKSFLG